MKVRSNVGPKPKGKVIAKSKVNYDADVVFHNDPKIKNLKPVPAGSLKKHVDNRYDSAERGLFPSPKKKKS